MTDKPAADLLFNDDGTVRLGKFYRLGISQAVHSMKPRMMPSRFPGAEARIQARRGLLTRQPTEERALLVAEAVADEVLRRGFTTEVRPSKSGETFGLYLKLIVPETDPNRVPLGICTR